MKTSPRIAFAMEDDYPWDLVREQQLPEMDMDVWHDCLSWDEAVLTQRLRDVTAVVSGRKSPMMPDALITDPGKFQTLIHCHGGIRGLVSQQLLV